MLTIKFMVTIVTIIVKATKGLVSDCSNLSQDLALFVQKQDTGSTCMMHNLPRLLPRQGTNEHAPLQQGDLSCVGARGLRACGELSEGPCMAILTHILLLAAGKSTLLQLDWRSPKSFHLSSLWLQTKIAYVPAAACKAGLLSDYPGRQTVAHAAMSCMTASALWSPKAQNSSSCHLLSLPALHDIWKLISANCRASLVVSSDGR